LGPAAALKEARRKIHERYGERWDRTQFGHAQPAEFVELLVEACCAERSFDAAYNRFMEHIQQEGIEVEVSQEILESFTGRLFDIRLKRKLIHATGLGVYEDQILLHEIDRTFGPPNLPSPGGKKK